MLFLKGWWWFVTTTTNKDSALEAGRNVKYVEFEAERRLGHKYIYLAKEMSTIIPDFVSRATLLHNSTSSAPAA
ncbi:hypothetical protein Q1695_004468 [Nippostrongylus brasiliensis]|nr:hypothetical protein Q1695_004468 [Nippostrongylus brasiliensis]